MLQIYPPDQPMVFNPQNPNAPPIYPCGVCHKEVHDNDQAILCESGCNFWFHRYLEKFLLRTLSYERKTLFNIYTMNLLQGMHRIIGNCLSIINGRSLCRMGV